MTLKTKQEGFTIVELLIVIVVIIILAGLVLVTFNGVQQKGRNTERITDLKAIQSHLETYNAQNGKYPTLANLNTQPASGNWWIQDNLKGLDKEALKDPKGGTAYTIAATATTNQYAYQPTDDAGGACDNAATDCTKFTLTARQEGQPDQVLKSLQ